MKEGVKSQGIRLTGMQLKYIAMTCMLLDHIAGGILYPIIMTGSEEVSIQLGYHAMRAVGRIAFPIYCFLVAEGIKHSHNRDKYALSLWVFALLSEMPYNMQEFGQFFCMREQNVFFTIALAVTGYILANRTNKKWKKALILAIPLFIASFVRTDYSWEGVALLYTLFYMDFQKEMLAGAMLIFWSTSSIFGVGAYSCVIAILVNVYFMLLTTVSYSGERGRVYGSKYLYYMFYPAHLLIIGLIRMTFIQS